VILALMLAGSAPAVAQQVARSAGPDSVDVTVYRAPHRGAGEKMHLSWLNGYALISETRRISVPAGESAIRFEGVAGGIFPETAIVTGFPSGVIEKNQDAMLLSPGSLLDASLGKRVHLRRTSRATGKVREMEAIVRSGEGGAVVLQTAEGHEALRCTGLPETLLYDGVPPGLAAKPTLSVRVRAEQPVTAEVTLSYLASEFDWQADYVARLSPDGKAIDLFAWLTLANGDVTSFREADTQAVAGRLNREAIRAPKPRARPLTLECWAQGTTTSDLREILHEKEEIVVTGSLGRIASVTMSPPPAPAPPPPPAMMAQQEDLGDLKLYRIPEPVTVAAKSQKQVALMHKQRVKVETVYRQRVSLYNPGHSQVMRVLVTRNTAAAGLGLPLPSGKVAVFGEAGGRGRPLLVGRGILRDRAVGEEVEIPVGVATAVAARFANLSPPNQPPNDWEITVTNAQASPVRYEAELEEYGVKLTPATKLERRDGRPVWIVTVPANGRATLRYRLDRPKT
jgi:hypothetical protein